jgi:hypothetical protein
VQEGDEDIDKRRPIPSTKEALTMAKDIMNFLENKKEEDVSQEPLTHHQQLVS